jgi:hypothetical protein
LSRREAAHIVAHAFKHASVSPLAAWLHRLEDCAMPDCPGTSGGNAPTAHPDLPPVAGLDALKYRTAAEAALEPEQPAVHRVGTS